MKEEEDYLQERIAHDLENDPGFADAWAPFALMGRLIEERLRLGLSQRDVAARMGIGQSAIARMENLPNGVSFARVLAYARALGVAVELRPTSSAGLMDKRRGRRVSSGKAA